MASVGSWGLYVASVSCRRLSSIGPLYRSQGWPEPGHGYRRVDRTMFDVWSGGGRDKEEQERKGGMKRVQEGRDRGGEESGGRKKRNHGEKKGEEVEKEGEKRTEETEGREGRKTGKKE